MNDDDAVGKRVQRSHDNLFTTSIHDLKRRMKGQKGSLRHLKRLKRAMRDCGAGLEFAYVQYPGELKGWSYGLPAINQAQVMVGILNQLALNLTASIVEIEAEFPAEMQAVFNAERRKRAN